MIPAFFTGVALAIWFHLRLRKIARLVPSEPLAIQCLLLAIIVPLGVVLSTLLAGSGDIEASLETMLVLPLPTFFSGAVPAIFVDEFLRFPNSIDAIETTLGIVLVAVTCWEPIVVALILRRLVIARRSQRKSAKAHSVVGNNP